MLRIAHTLITFVIMRSNHNHIGCVVAAGLLLLGAAFTPPALAATFTYQGMLSDPNGPVTNTTSMQFSLWDAASGGGQVGSSFSAWNVDVADGLFTVDIDATNFGPDAFNGDPRWLQIDVDDGGWVTLSPRQPINPAPYALYAFDSAGGGGSCLWSEHGGDISYNTGDVGIGTAAPIYKLHVTDTGGGTAVAGENTGEYNYGYLGHEFAGVYASNNAPYADGKAIWGVTTGPNGFGGYFEGQGYFSGNVGVGVTNPSEKLDVAGMIRTTRFKLTTAPASGHVLTSDPNGVGTWQPGDGGSLWQENGLKIYYDAGNVGIGTSNPDTQFVVERPYDNNFNPMATFRTTGTNATGAVRFENGAGNQFNFGITGNDELAFGYNANIGLAGDVLRIAPTGNVGIGVTNPSEKLDVAGTIKTTGFKLTTTPTAGHVLTSDPNGVGAWQPGGGGSLWQENGLDIYYDTGNVGVGTSTPGYALHVVDSVSSAIVGENPAEATMGQLGSEWAGVYGESPTSRAVYGVATASGAVSNYGVYGEAAGDSGYGVYGEVTGSGGFGVYGLSDGGGGVYGKATSSTESTAGVHGRAESPLGSGVHGENFGASGDAVGVKGISYAPSGFGGYFIGRGYFSGNVGVGTSTPSYRLHAVSTGGATAVAGVNPTESTYGYLGHEYGGVYGEGPYAGYFVGQGYFSDNVGIGTTSPDTPLDILGGNWDVANTEGDLRVGNDTYRLKMGVAVDGVGAGSCRIFAQGGSNRLTLGSNTTDIMTLVDGGVGIGFPNPDEALCVGGRVRIVNTLGGEALDIDTPGNGIYIESAGKAFDCLGNTLGVRGYSNSGIGVHAECAGTTTAHPALLVENNNASGIAIFSSTDSSDANTVITNMGAGDLIKGFSGATGNDLVFKVTNDGTTHTNVLQINGGSDLAEKFDVSEKTEPGAVVAIDPDNPGKLCVASGAYNRCVAGVISGANGVDTGMVLADLPDAENSQPVALSGRVWVKCDASQRAIEPGDLLTTSERPGHAMTVTDYSRAHGAVIGKAMSRLAQGETGMVLVLVNLQ